MKNLLARQMNTWGDIFHQVMVVVLVMVTKEFVPTS
jgi:hypothetical protein